MDINRELAIKILKYLDQHQDFYFPFLVMNKEYTEKGNDFVEIEPREWKLMKEDKSYKTFQLWENLQYIDEPTLKLMAKGFLEKIANQSLQKSIFGLAKVCKKYSSKDMWLTHKVVDYGENQFIAGKAEAYEDCLDLIKEYTN